MERACAPKSSFLSRRDDRPAGTVFAAIHDGIVMVHALDVLPEHRRRGVGRALMAGVKRWAEQQGASHLALVVTQANSSAQALYSSLGMVRVGKYHYRMKMEGRPT
jgi:GNAT superfamily N-acetyltransferase